MPGLPPHDFLSKQNYGSNMIPRARLYDFSLVLLGVAALVMKRHIDGEMVQSYGGNIAASFSTFFLLKLPFVSSKYQVAVAAALVLLVTALFEATNGFGFMSNTYDPADYLANAVGVVIAVAVNTFMQFATRPRKRPYDFPGASQ